MCWQNKQFKSRTYSNPFSRLRCYCACALQLHTVCTRQRNGAVCYRTGTAAQSRGKLNGSIHCITGLLPALLSSTPPLSSSLSYFILLLLFVAPSATVATSVVYRFSTDLLNRMIKHAVLCFFIMWELLHPSTGHLVWPWSVFAATSKKSKNIYCVTYVIRT